jgi:hypothetical protein
MENLMREVEIELQNKIMSLSMQYSELSSRLGQIGVDLEHLKKINNGLKTSGVVMSKVKEAFDLSVEWCKTCGKYTLHQQDVCQGVHDDATETL